MLRICQVGTGSLPIPSGGAGGVENTVHYLSEALSALGHTVTVIDVPKNGRAGTQYEVFEAGPLWPRFSNLPEHAFRGLTFQFGVWRLLSRLIAERRFDVVHFHGQLGAGANIRLARKGGALAVFSTHNAVWGSPILCQSKPSKAKFVWEMDAFRHAGGIICDSATMRDNLIRFLGVPEGKILDVPIGVDEETLLHRDVSPRVRATYRPEGSQMLLNVARTAPYKDQLTLVRAMALVHRALPSTRLYIAGPFSDRAYREKLAKEVKHLGLAEVVTFLGQVPRPLLLELLELCDVFVLSSVTEALGLSLLEAMAKAKPIVATALGPIREVLPSRGGMVVSPQDRDSMGRAILEMLHNPKQAREMGARARDHVLTGYRWSGIAERTVRAYEMFRLGLDKA